MCRFKIGSVVYDVSLSMDVRVELGSFSWPLPSRIIIPYPPLVRHCMLRSLHIWLESFRQARFSSRLSFHSTLCRVS